MLVETWETFWSFLAGEEGERQARCNPKPGPKANSTVLPNTHVSQ